MNFKNAEVAFIEHCRYEKNLADKTIKFYLIDLKQFHEFLLKEVSASFQVADIDKQLIKEYLKVISNFKPKTIKRKIATAKAFFNYLEFEDIVLINPFRKVRIKIKDSRALPTVLSSDEVQSIFTCAYRVKKSTMPGSSQYATAIKDIAVLELLFATGVRVSELCNLKSENIDVGTGTIKVLGKGSKERLIQICHKQVKAALLEYEKLFHGTKDNSGYYFVNRQGNRLSEQSVRFMVKRLANDSSIGKHVTPHTFRHSFATLLLEEDVDIKYIQHFLGHSSIATTQLYTHVNQAKQEQILSRKHPRNGF